MAAPTEHVRIILLPFPAWEHIVHRRLLSKKIGKCDEGIELSL